MIKTVGLKWDNYTPGVEGQVVRDLIAMQHLGPRIELNIACVDNSADKVINALGLNRANTGALAKLWITYRTSEESVVAPEHATEVIERDLYVPKLDGNIETEEQMGYYMKPQGSVIPQSINLNKPMPSPYGVADPFIVMLWS